MPPRGDDQIPVLTPGEPGRVLPGRIGELLPDSGWRDRVPTNLAKELAAIRRRHDPAIREALKDPRTSRRFIADPSGVLDDLKVPMSDELRKRLKTPGGMERLAVPRRMRLPGRQIVSPSVNVRIQEEPDAATAPRPMGLFATYLWDPFESFFKPTGQMNHGYPVVYEITKSCIRDLVAQWFDRGPLGSVLEDLTEKVENPVLRQLIKAAQLVAKGFDLDLDLGMPAGMATGYQDILTITLRIPRPEPGAPPSSGDVRVSAQLRIAASVVVDHSDPQKEQFHMDLANRLAFCEAKITVENVPVLGTQVIDLSAQFRQYLQGSIARIKVFFDVPVDRSGANPLMPKQLDVKIIDDASSADCDALALLLSFADMGPGDRNAFTRSFISGGSGLVVDFNWLRARILPQVESALGLPSPINRQTGFWMGQAPIAGGDGAVLTLFGLGVMRGSREITVLVGVRKEGDCYTATGSMSATLSLRVENGVLVFDPPQFSQPYTDVDIPWYCYLLSILVGGILSDILLGVVGSLVGAVVAPILLHSIQGVAESVLKDVIDSVNSTINDGTAGIQQIDLGGFKTLLQYASIDDLLVLQGVDVVDSIPALKEGTVFIPNGGYLDLTTGQVAPISGNRGHLGWAGSGSSRVLMSLGGTAVAPVGNLDPGCVTRYRLYRCDFGTTQRLTLGQLATWSSGGYQQNGMVWAARTTENHYARFNVTGVGDDGLWLHYKTFPRQVAEQEVAPVLELRGGFEVHTIQVADASPRPPFESLVGKGLGAWGAWFDPNRDWCNRGTFYANWVGFTEPLSLDWKVQGQALQGGTGTVTVNGVGIQYEVYGSQLDLMMYPIVIMDVAIEAHVRDAEGREGTASLTARTREGGWHRDPGSRFGRVPRLDEYIAAYKKHIGPWIDVDPEVVSDQGYRVDVEVIRDRGPGIIG